MSRYHVKADGSMGVCTARDGNCPFGGEAGTKHFTNEAEARKYSEELIGRNSGNRSLKKSPHPSIEPDTASTSMSSDGNTISQEAKESTDTYGISLMELLDATDIYDNFIEDLKKHQGR